MWKHVLYTQFIYTVTAVSNKVEKTEADESSPLNDAVNRIESDVSYIDDRFERPGQAAPQILNFRLKNSDDDPQNVDFHWMNPDTNQPQKIDFHIDLPDINSPHMLEFNLGSPGLRLSQKSPGVLSWGARQSYTNTSSRRSNRALIHRKSKEPILRAITTTKNHPYLAAVIINGRLWCAGAIVDENWILTAAHCLNFVLHVSPLKYLGEHVKVRVGSSRPHEGGAVFDVVGAVRHPKFEEEPVPHADIALLKIAGNMVFDRYTNIIKIYNGVQEPLAQSFIVVAGWGASKGEVTAIRNPLPELNSGRLKVRSQTYCIDSYQLVNDFEFTPDLFCASLRNGTRDACVFDAGAPAVQQNRLMGIMSFGPEHCGTSAQPAVFIKAFYFRDFVKSTIAQYKTTKELIKAMQEMTDSPNPQIIKDGRIVPSALISPDDEHSGFDY